MLPSPPTDPRVGNNRQRAIAQKLMMQMGRENKRRRAFVRNGANMSTGRLTKFSRAKMIPRIARAVGGGLGEFGSIYNIIDGLGVQGTPGAYESSPGPGIPASDPPTSLLPTPTDPFAAGNIPQGQPNVPSQYDAFMAEHADSSGGTSLEPRNWFDTGVVDQTGWVHLGNGLYYDPVTQSIRGDGGGAGIAISGGGRNRSSLPV